MQCVNMDTIWVATLESYLQCVAWVMPACKLRLVIGDRFTCGAWADSKLQALATVEKRRKRKGDLNFANVNIPTQDMFSFEDATQNVVTYLKSLLSMLKRYT